MENESEQSTNDETTKFNKKKFDFKDFKDLILFDGKTSGSGETYKIVKINLNIKNELVEELNQVKN